MWQAVKCFIDLRGSPSKKVIKSLAAFCKDPVERDDMIALSASKELMQEKLVDKHHGLLELMTMLYPSCRPSLEALLQLGPAIMPRYYTIASSNLAHPDQIRIAISLTIDS